MKIKPLGSHVAIQEEETEESTMGGIIIPSKAQEKPCVGRVLEIGPGEMVDGKMVKVSVAPGDRVLYSKYSGTEFKVSENEKYLIIKNSDILAIIQ